MSRRTQFAILLTRPALKTTLFGGVLACASIAPGLHSQTPAAAATPATLAPAAPAAGTPASGATPRIYTLNQSPGSIQFQPSASYRIGDPYSGFSSHSIADPLAARTGFGSFSGGRQFSGMGDRTNGLANLFPSGGGLSPAGTVPQALPSLNQFLRGSFSLRSNISVETYRFAHQDVLRPEVNFGDLARPQNSLIFSTSDLGNGMFLSAGTGFGHSTAGAPAAGLSSNPSAEGKRLGPSLAVKLSF